MKRTWMFLLVAFLLLFCGCGTVKPASAGERQTYGVFLGRNGDEIGGLTQYEIVVIEPEEFTQEQIAALKQAGCTVYGYLNIGNIGNTMDSSSAWRWASMRTGRTSAGWMCPMRNGRRF